MASTIKTRSSLKNVFNDPGTLLFQSTDFNLASASGNVVLTPEYELPVHVGDITLSQDAPTVNHYKVIGLDGDWVSSAESGDFNVNFFVPSSHKEIYKLAYGAAAVTDLSTLSLLTGDDISAVGMNLAGSWGGYGVNTKKNKITGYFALINSAENHVVLIRNAALYATIEWNNAETEPLGVRFTGTVENDGSGATIIHLMKNYSA